jgi:hypothetical protein
MKKLFVGILMLLMLIGCTGINQNVAVDVATDTAFVLALQNNPQYKPAVVVALTEIKALLNGSLTYDDLLVEITKKLPGKYAVIGVILSGYIATDKPLFETTFPMLDSYKKAVCDKIDRFLLLAK